MSDADRLRVAIMEADAFGHHDTATAVCRAIAEEFEIKLDPEWGDLDMGPIATAAVCHAILEVAEGRR